MNNEIKLLKQRFQREKNIRQQAEMIAEKISRELYLKGIELEKALQIESHTKKEIEILYEKVKELARIDPLTGLNNRRSFYDTALQIFQSAIRYKDSLSCAMLDIDFFKQVNDTYGHDVGDKVLLSVAQTCKKQIRTVDLLARFGGEEFCFLFCKSNIHESVLVAERIRYAISELKFNSGNNWFSITVSIGISELLSSNDNIENMIKRSDKSLYKAKRNGRNRVVLCEKSKV